MYLSENWFYTHPSLSTPISETHEILKNGRQLTNNCRKKTHKKFNFNSYQSKELNTKKNESILKVEFQDKLFQISTYRRDFNAPYPLVCPAKSLITDDIDPLFNRRPLNCFHMLPYAPGKFMDDHFLEASEARKKINFFRQIRQMSHIDKINN